MQEKKNILTYEGLRKYEEELHDLKVVKRQEVAQKINRLEFHEDKVNIELNIRQTWRSLENLLSQIKIAKQNVANAQRTYCLLYTSDAADD